MTAFNMISTVPAAISWSIGPLIIRGNDVYAVIGLIIGLALLLVWVVIENFRQSRWRPGRAANGRAESGLAAQVALLASARARQDKTPVAARPEWLLDDNTLVRIKAVRRESVGLGASQSRAMGGASLVVDPAPPTRDSRMKAKRPMHIAMMGTRGIPARAGDFEMAVEQVATRLVERGHQVTVYCRPEQGNRPEATYRGVRLVTLPTLGSGRFAGMAHTWLSLMHGQFRRHDVAQFWGVDSGALAGFPRLFGRPAVVNAESGAAGSRSRPSGTFFERLAATFASCIVADSRRAEKHFRDSYRTPAFFVPSGVDISRRPAGETVNRLGLRPDGYILWVGRLEPANNAHDIVEAYQRLGGLATGLQLCLVGDTINYRDYAAGLRHNAGPGVVFAGDIFGDGYQELGSNARVTVFTNDTGDTQRELMNALAFGACVIYSDVPANRETVDDAAIPYTGGASDLAGLLAQTVRNPALVADYRQRAARRAATVASWDAVTDRYEELYSHVARDY